MLVIACDLDISIHAAREGGDRLAQSAPRCHAVFQSTPPVKAATQKRSCTMRMQGFQSTPPVKAATSLSITKSTQREFQSTPPVKAATIYSVARMSAVVISIHAAREGGDPRGAHARRWCCISIHAAREGGDRHNVAQCIICSISIHAAREGGDEGSRLLR